MAFRLWYTSVSGFPRSWLTTHMPCASDPLSTRHTGRADFPHPAFPDTFAIGMRNEGRLLLGLLAQLLSQKREFRRQSPPLRNGSISLGQAVLPSSYISTYLAGPLRSTDVTPLPRYYAPRRLPTRASPAVMHSRKELGSAPARSGLPGSWLIVRRAPPPITPESSTAAHARCFTVDNRLHQLWKAGRSRLVFRGRSGFTLLRLTASPSKAPYPGLLRRTLGQLLVERATYKVNSFQLTRSTRLPGAPEAQR